MSGFTLYFLGSIQAHNHLAGYGLTSEIRVMGIIQYNGKISQAHGKIKGVPGLFEFLPKTLYSTDMFTARDWLGGLHV